MVVVDRLQEEHQGEEGVLLRVGQGGRLVDLEEHHQEEDHVSLVVLGDLPREAHRQRHQDQDHPLAHHQGYPLVEDQEDLQEDRSGHLEEEHRREALLEVLLVAQPLDQ